MRSDMDVFLTPLFATWLPRHCNDFNVGAGQYSSPFNDKRLMRAAARIHFNHAFKRNFGSTWYSTPDNIRLVSYLTLCAMVYLSVEEFTPAERDNKLGTALWPDWHYLVFNLIIHYIISF